MFDAGNNATGVGHVHLKATRDAIGQCVNNGHLLFTRARLSEDRRNLDRRVLDRRIDLRKAFAQD